MRELTVNLYFLSSYDVDLGRPPVSITEDMERWGAAYAAYLIAQSNVPNEKPKTEGYFQSRTMEP